MNILVKKELSTKESEAIPYLLKGHPHLFVSSGVFTFFDYSRYFIDKIAYSLGQNNKNRLLIMKNGGILGMALLKFMEWDSNFFRIPMGSVECILTGGNQENKGSEGAYRDLLKNCGMLARSSGIKVLYVSVESTRYSLIRAVNYLGYIFICGQMRRLIRKEDMFYLEPEKKINAEYKFRRYEKNDYPQIIKISKEIDLDVESKFSLTSYLSRSKSTGYYSESIKNCCLGINADEIFVAERKGAVSGFVCYRYDKSSNERLGRKICFSVIGGICRLERKKNIGTNLLNWSYKQVFKNSQAILGNVYLHNSPMMGLTLRRSFAPSADFIYTFCDKL